MTSWGSFGWAGGWPTGRRAGGRTFIRRRSRTSWPAAGSSPGSRWSAFPTSGWGRGSSPSSSPPWRNSIRGRLMKSACRTALRVTTVRADTWSVNLSPAPPPGKTSDADVKAFPQIERDGMSHLAWNIAAPERCPKPVLCAIEKYAMGVGLELAMACDIRIATQDSLLALPEVTLGQIPGSGGSQRIARIAGLTRAVDMMMLGRRIPAPEACHWGLLTRVVEDSD